MAESINPDEVTSASRPTPDLPKKLTDLRRLVIAGTVVWTAALVVLFAVRLGDTELPAVWLWTCVAGVTLGLIGLGIMAWQRAASHRGSKGAQRGI